MSLATRTHPAGPRRRTPSRETTMTAEATTAHAAQPVVAQSASHQGREQPMTTAAIGRQHPYALRTALTPLEAQVVRGLVVGNMTTWPLRAQGSCCGAHFDTANDHWTAQLLLAAIRTFTVKKARRDARRDGR